MPAHVTLFHALPDDEVGVSAALDGVGRGRFMVEVAGVRMLGRGVAFELRSAALSARRAAIASRFAGRLSRQDSAPFRPHITVQNKVAAEDARALHASLSAGFVPERAEAAAFHVWRYCGGPWEALLTVEMADGSAS